MKLKLKMIQVRFAEIFIETTIKHFSTVFVRVILSFCNLACVSSVRNLSHTERSMEEYYDVYDYYGEGDAQLALLLSVFSVIMGALAWLRKVQSSFNL